MQACFSVFHAPPVSPLPLTAPQFLEWCPADLCSLASVSSTNPCEAASAQPAPECGQAPGQALWRETLCQHPAPPPLRSSPLLGGTWPEDAGTGLGMPRAWFSASGSAEKPGLAEQKAARGLSVPRHGRRASRGAGCSRRPGCLARQMPPAGRSRSWSCPERGICSSLCRKGPVCTQPGAPDARGLRPSSCVYVCASACVCACARVHATVLLSLCSVFSRSRWPLAALWGSTLSWSRPGRKREPLGSHLSSKGSELALVRPGWPLCPLPDQPLWQRAGKHAAWPHWGHVHYPRTRERTRLDPRLAVGTRARNPQGSVFPWLGGRGPVSQCCQAGGYRSQATVTSEEWTPARLR